MNYEDTIAGSYLTEREMDVLRLIGKRNKIIAKELNISDSTVKTHIRNIMNKMGRRDRRKLARTYTRWPLNE